MKKFMTMSAFFLSAACLSVHTPSFANGFIEDISLGAEKATQGLLNNGSKHHRRQGVTHKDETTHSQSAAYDDKKSYDTQFSDRTSSASAVVDQDPLSSTKPSTASIATPDTSPKTQQQSSQSVPQERGDRTDTLLQSPIRPAAPKYTSQE